MSSRTVLTGAEIEARVADAAKYDWLHADDEIVARWVDDQDGRARAYLDTLPQLSSFREDLTTHLNVEVRQLPVVRGHRQFQLRRRAGEQQFSLWVSDGTTERVLIDSSTIGSEQDSIAEFSPSPDGSTVAWTVSTGGADWMIGRFRDAETGVDAPDELVGIKWPAFAWLDDARVAYMSWGDATAGEELTAINQDASVRLHTLGQPQTDDREIYRPTSASWCFPAVSADRQWITIQQSDGTTPAHVYRKPATLEGGWETVVTGPGPDAVIAVHNDETLILSFRENPAGTVSALTPGAEPRLIFAADDAAPIADAKVVGERLVLLELPLAGSVLRFVPLSDAAAEVVVPFAAGTRVMDFGAGSDDASVLVDIEPIGGERRTVELPFSSPVAELSDIAAGGSEWVTRIVEATSADGTRVPMKVVHAPGFIPDGNAKVFLSVYGGYAVPYLATGYDAWHVAWLRAGGVLAYAGVRGGSDLGEAWHAAAKREGKQKGGDDLVACAEWFTENGWSGARAVAINGMSNGGMMVSIALTQSPHVLGAAIPEVPVVDMLNFHRYTVGHGWVFEFGNPDVAEDRAFLAAYSPLHNVRADVDYPPTLIVTADKDDRVPPGPHAYKLAAALADVPSVRDRVFLRVEPDAGHAAGRSMTAKIEERAAVLAFAAASLALNSPPRRGPGSGAPFLART
ncbi:prolyl oligopeptidase family serine peptidase [Microbacterium sp. YY-03]|uniref:prolyl oligopeptidase family serine peptidase n=1 Tax=Microbacterium sp. YY-03 TaxID=3421636 RepID=UPI003D181945